VQLNLHDIHDSRLTRSHYFPHNCSCTELLVRHVNTALIFLLVSACRSLGAHRTPSIAPLCVLKISNLVNENSHAPVREYLEKSDPANKNAIRVDSGPHKSSAPTLTNHNQARTTSSGINLKVLIFY
jgi:hypothetical protein